jgi:hypothetical protein
MSLIDDLMQGLGKEVSKVKVRSQELMKTYNLSQEIRELDRKKTAKFIEIGRLIYDKYERQDELSEEIFKERVKEIVGIEKDIVHLQAELDSLQMQNDPTVSASKKAEAKAGYTATPGFTCSKCHAPANREKAFCPTCGEPLKSGNTQTEQDSP